MTRDFTDVQVAMENLFPAQVLVRHYPMQLPAGAKEYNITSIRSRNIFVHGYLVFIRQNFIDILHGQMGKMILSLLAGPIVESHCSLGTNDVPGIPKPRRNVSFPSVR